MAKTMILVAAATLVGMAKGEAKFRLPQGEELTAGAKKKLGLTDKDIDELIARGQVVETEVRAAEGAKGDAEAIAAATKRAEDAEAKVKALEARVAELEKPKA